tara:strand:+ start:12810 stop:13778 length:969 start_codon:yes stop_codon:yes gene_type:complete
MNTTIRQQQWQDKSLKLSCIVPVHNEAQAIVEFLTQLNDELKLHSNDYEIIAVDDGSHDESLANMEALIASMPLKIIGLSRNFGKEKALTAGLEHCSGDATILIDSDFQHPFTSIKTFVENWVQGYDMVYGVRTSRKGEGFIKKAFSRLFYKLTHKLNEVPIPKDAGDFRLLDRAVVDALTNCHERNRFMKGLYAWVGFKSLAVPFEVQDRTHGQSSWSFSRLFSLALDGIFSFSNAPLRMWTFVGLIISLIAFFYGLWIVFSTLYYGVDTPGFATIIVAVMFLGGIQLLSIGILGEYIGRIFTEVKHRPNYIIAKKIGFND